MTWCALYFPFFSSRTTTLLHLWMLIAVIYGFVYSITVVADTVWLIVYVIVCRLIRRTENRLFHVWIVIDYASA